MEQVYATNNVKETITPFIVCPTIPAIIPSALAAARMDVLRASTSTKRDVFERVFSTTKKNYLVNIDHFVTLLTDYSQEGYNGIRAYLACYPQVPTSDERKFVPLGREGQLTLLFVPTRKIDAYPTTGVDDPTQFWQLRPDRPAQALPAPGTVEGKLDFVTNWIANYRKPNGPKSEFESDGRAYTQNSCFKETCSHWYDLDIFRGNSSQRGLIEYIACARQISSTNPKPIVGLSISFAGFTDNDPHGFPPYQITIIFQLLQEGDNGDDFKDIRYQNSFFGSAKAVPADTGIPCPPAGSCDGSSV